MTLMKVSVILGVFGVALTSALVPGLRGEFAEALLGRAAAVPVAACKCGVKAPTSRIVSGTDPTAGEHPWVAIIRNGDEFKCAGTLISDEWVATSAGCIPTDTSNLKVELGSTNMKTSDAKALKVDAKAVIKHKDAFPYFSEYDIALIQLKTPVVWATHTTIIPICLPEKLDEDYDGKTGTALGWGRPSESGDMSDTLKKVSQAIISNSYCANFNGPRTNHETILCAGGAGSSPCTGDEGGPLEMKGDKATDLIGIISTGYGCGTVYPWKYARVTALTEWIKTKIDVSKLCARPT